MKIFQILFSGLWLCFYIRLSITSNSYTRKNPTVDNIRCLLINNGEQQQQQKQLSQFSDHYSNMLIAFCQYGDMVLIVLKNELSGIKTFTFKKLLFCERTFIFTGVFYINELNYAFFRDSGWIVSS